jgi:hypothetical protein
MAAQVRARFHSQPEVKTRYLVRGRQFGTIQRIIQGRLVLFSEALIASDTQSRRNGCGIIFLVFVILLFVLNILRMHELFVFIQTLLNSLVALNSQAPNVKRSSGFFQF